MHHNRGMNTPILSKKQQKNALRANKGPKETIKHVLSNPYKNYFPLLQADDVESLKLAISGNLSKMVIDKYSVPWKVLKDIPKHERRQYKRDYNLSNNDSVVAEIQSGMKLNLVVGTNTVTKLLEKDQVSSVLLNGDANPQLIIKHILSMCVLKNVSVLVVPKFDDILKHVIGIKSTAVAIKSPVQINTKLFILDNFIKEMSQNYPVPESDANINADSSQEKQSDESLGQNMQHLDLKPQDNPDSQTSSCAQPSNTDDKRSNDYCINLHLSRDNSRKRAFEPAASEKRPENKTDDNFLGLGQSSNKKKSNYNNLNVKRIRNNRNRPRKY